ncbi:MAG TPA: Vms1/Ankzf1 family peptidyl-tRNA hydrolase [Blastocatellia bacterium]|jgi:peptide chain release factor subunit 1|nr:Vms1/Ankzf1 family peptidyl-tRNA hydrolase [Blastocatellia bacterium]
MTLDELLDRLASFEPTGFPFVSLYLNAQPDEHGSDNFHAFVRKELSDRSKTYPPSSAERQSFDIDAGRIMNYIENEVQPQANGLAIFACAAADDFFEAVQLGAPIPNNRLYVYEQPHLYPLARLMDQYPRYAVLVANTNSARLFVFGRGKRLDSEQVQGKKTNRTKVGGWSQMRYQRHLENYHLHHAKEVIDTLERVVREDAAQHVILAGDEVIIPLLREQMPQQLADKVIDVVKLDINTPEHEILEETAGVLRDRDRETDAEKVARLLDEYRAGGLAVAGVDKTLAALSNGQVDELFLTATPGAITYSEKKVERVIEAYDAGASADLDTSEARVVADELIRRAQATSARVTFIEDATLLATVGGVGAMLRYQI